ncbi:PREDICTED: cysteine-rich receptor-like protein kinase 29 [Brassica oleracea var. oleracea]|uniref:Cysteine-rich receptor-like protein kinase 29 n=1 Tax=Brassica oleracea var. oleracea TaxID=109376 RepID=A0A0D3DF92_BRAOL|nr:PREDICTED: cysteine-rich receptor-like protein kinase 29 [Brassica oleracea var. oleracea]
MRIEEKKALTQKKKELQSSMECVRVIVFFACVLTFVPFHALAQVDIYVFGPKHICSNRGNFTVNSTFAGNLNRLISSLSSLTSQPYGFYNLTSGSGESAYAIGLCRREVKRDACLSCIQTAATNLTEQCQRSKQAVIYFTHCMFRYSNGTIYGRKETSPTQAFVSGTPISNNRDEFERLQRVLLDRLKGMAAAGGPNRKYAQGNGTASPGYGRFYGSAQCSPDLSEQDCDDCLTFGFQRIPSCCDAQTGLRWFCPSCNFRFETSRFYELEIDLEADPPAIQPPDDTPTSAAETERTGKGKGGSKVVIAIVVPIVLVALFAVLLCLVLKWKKNKSGNRVIVLGNSHLSGSVVEDEFLNTDSLVIDFEDLKAATNNFSSENELGRGGFGSVYKGVSSHGQEIAVKRLSGNSGQGDIEFKNEILLLAKLQHRNLVRLLGFCIHGQERLLVYEFIKNASLDHFIFDLEKRQLLDWGVRYKMIRGVARGLLYLHEDSRFRIIHRDLKASNILLDQELIPKIADFGLAKLFDTGQNTTHRFTNRIAGTYGYMAPEYALYGQFSVKTDVFSFGVLVIEIITGKRSNNGGSNDDEDSENLLTWVWRSWREDIIKSVIDPSLSTGSTNEILRCIHIGLLCVQENAATRPTMASVALMLNSDSFTLPTPTWPAFVLESVMPQNVSSSSTEELQMSSNDVTISELCPR